MPRKPSRLRFRRPPFRSKGGGSLWRSSSPSSPRLFNWWLLWRVPALALAAVLVWWFVLKPINQEQDWMEFTESFALCGEGKREAGCVVDGDTIILGEGASIRRIRFTGFDAPELEGACDTERRLAQAAKIELHQWLEQGPFEWTGADDPPRDQYGRELRAARRTKPDGTSEALSEVMIAKGLAIERGWGEGPPDWCKD